MNELAKQHGANLNFHWTVAVDWNTLGYSTDDVVAANCKDLQKPGLDIPLSKWFEAKNKVPTETNHQLADIDIVLLTPQTRMYLNQLKAIFPDTTMGFIKPSHLINFTALFDYTLELTEKHKSDK